MIPRTVRVSLAAFIAAAFCLISASSRADVTKDQCIDANAKAQDLRRGGKLSAAREQLRLCSSASCPAIVRNDCTKRLDELEGVQPAIIFDAKDGSGRDLSAVKVTVDGHPLTEKLDGTALLVDPGEHAFVFTVPDEAPVTQTFVLKEGDGERRERIVIGARPTAPVSPENASATAQPAISHGLGPQRILGVVAGVVGVAGIAAGSVFAVMTTAAGNQQQKDCPTSSCGAQDHMLAANDHSTGETDRTISIVGFAAGGALLVSGAVLFLTGRHASEASPTTGMLLVPSVGPGGGGVFLRGEF